jgi:uncharacterized protein YkwD
MSNRSASAAPARAAEPVARTGQSISGATRRSAARGRHRLSLLVVIAFAASSIGIMALPATTFGWSANAFNSASERQLQALTNRSRSSAGRKTLRWDSALASIARWRSKDMITRNYFSHNIPGGGKVFDEMSDRGYCYKVAGENIGWNNYPDDAATAQIHKMFMNSSGHRSNILARDWDRIGIGAYKGSDGKKMWTVLFADKCGSDPVAAKPKPKPKPQPKPAAAKPKPAATPKPKPKPQPTATPTAEPTDQLAPRETAEGGQIATTPGVPARLATVPSAGGSLRAVDRSAPGGLLESIVGGVAGFFFGG